jgi:hypothetical protein
LRIIPPILVVLSLAGCHPAPARAAPAPVLPAVAEALPVVRFHLMRLRDWESPYFIIESEDVDLTLPAAIEMGLPAELWIRCAIENPPGFRQEIYWVRPLRA